MSLKSAVKEAERFRAGWSALSEIIAAIDEANGLDQHIAELRSASLIAQRDLDALKAEISKATGEASRVIAAAGERASDIRSAAEAEAGRLVEAAAARISAERESAAQAIAAQRDDAAKRQAEAYEALRQAKERLSSVEASIDERGAYLDDINQKIAAAREAARGLLGG